MIPSIKAEVFIKIGLRRNKDGQVQPVANHQTTGCTTQERNGFRSSRVTIWRFLSKATDKTKELVEEDEGQTDGHWSELKMERCWRPGKRSDSVLNLCADGYLYVIDRRSLLMGTG